MTDRPANRPLTRRVVELYGVVQGVGFRPALHRLATAAGLGGEARNAPDGVRLVLEGPADTVDRFLAALPSRLPPSAEIIGLREVERVALDRPPRREFVIAESDGDGAPRVVIPADLAVCPECARDVFDPADRRYGYPFTTCTACGPRYTVLRALPYDRARTSLDVFPLCPDCDREYRNPADRRFHAESIACPRCGPRLRFADAAGRDRPGDPIRAARALLAAGGIVAVRGLGGFLLAANAVDRDAVARLRARKRRPHKPLAVMAASLDVARRSCAVPPEAAALLASPAAPIVILDLRPDPDPRLPADLLTPDTPTLGVLLPTTPLHLLLARPLQGDPTPAFDWLVMTSGNRGGEPIAISNAEALERLAGIADGFLFHDRDILLRCDDSLCAIARGAPQIWRRARGWAPRPIALRRPLARAVLAFGPQQKNTIAIGADRDVVLSPHLGDLDTPEAVEGLERALDRLLRFLARTPDAVAVDLHPDYVSTRLGREWAAARGLPVVPVQHHHAHAAACLAEHGVEEALALVFDGTGYGTDGRIWGAELLRVNAGGFARLATFAPAPLPGGDAATLDPRRQLAGRLAAAGITPRADALRRWDIAEDAFDVWRRQIAAGIQTSWSSAAGRVFDSVAVALGAADGAATYDGRPAIRLEALARRAARATPAPFAAEEREGLFVVDWTPLFGQLAEAPPPDPGALAMGFHEAVATAARQMAEWGAARTGLRRVALSGGCFMNRLLNDLLIPQLDRRGFEILLHQNLPTNDGGIALGQAIVAGGHR